MDKNIVMYVRKAFQRDPKNYRKKGCFENLQHIRHLFI